MKKNPLPFEEPIHQLNEQIEKLKKLSKNGEVGLEDEIKTIEKRAEKIKQDIYNNLTAHQIVQIARHPNRPDTTSIVRLIFDKFIPLHGDRMFKDDPSIIGGLAKFQGLKCMVIGHQKGHDTKENIRRNFGMPHPEGYRKALRLMKLAEKFNLPIITFIDTPGAYPGLEAEERGQSEAIAKNLKEMAVLKVPVISFVIGEGGSGGALAIGVSNKVFMLEYSVYSVISPEGCASILFKDNKQADKAAELLKLTAPNIKKLGVIDDIIPEPKGGAHTNWEEISQNIKNKIESELKELKQLSAEELIENRFKKFMSMGFYQEKKEEKIASEKI